MREHALVSDRNMRQNVHGWLEGRGAILAKAVGRLKDARAGGAKTVVDLTAVDLGRDGLFIEDAAGRPGCR